MTELGLLGRLDHNKYLGQFNGPYSQGGPSVIIEEFEVNPQLLAILHKRKFTGESDSEDPFAHLDFFQEICGTFRLKGHTDEEVKLKLFSQTLSDTAHSWYRVGSAKTLATWSKLSEAFLARFHPKVKSYEGRRVITNFKNRPGEGLVKAYIRFQGLLLKFPQHDLPPWYVLRVFYGGLNEANRTELDLASGGVFMDYSIKKAWQLLDKIRSNREAWSFDLGSDGGVEIEYDCIRAFQKTGLVDDLAKDMHLDTDIVLQVLKTFTEEMGAPKKGWTGYVPPPKEEKLIQQVALEPIAERPPYVETVPFPRTMWKHILAQQLAEKQKIEDEARREKEEAERLIREKEAEKVEK